MTFVMFYLVFVNFGIASYSYPQTFGGIWVHNGNIIQGFGTLYIYYLINEQLHDASRHTYAY